MFANLQNVADHNEKGTWIRRNRHPNTVRHQNLQSLYLVGSHECKDLRVRVLAEPNSALSHQASIHVFLQVFAPGRVVIEPQQ